MCRHSHIHAVNHIIISPWQTKGKPSGEEGNLSGDGKENVLWRREPLFRTVGNTRMARGYTRWLLPLHALPSSLRPPFLPLSLPLLCSCSWLSPLPLLLVLRGLTFPFLFRKVSKFSFLFRSVLSYPFSNLSSGVRGLSSLYSYCYVVLPFRFSLRYISKFPSFFPSVRLYLFFTLCCVSMLLFLIWFLFLLLLSLTLSTLPFLFRKISKFLSFFPSVLQYPFIFLMWCAYASIFHLPTILLHCFFFSHGCLNLCPP